MDGTEGFAAVMEQLTTLASTYREFVYANYFEVAYTIGALTFLAYIITGVRSATRRQSADYRSCAANVPFIAGTFWPTLVPFVGVLFVLAVVLHTIHFLMTFSLASAKAKMTRVKSSIRRTKEDATAKVVEKRRRLNWLL